MNTEFLARWNFAPIIEGDMAKERKATDKMNVALSGLESALSLIEPGNDVSATLLTAARRFADNIREQMLAIQQYASKI